MKSAIMVSVYLLERTKVSQDHRRLIESMVHYYVQSDVIVEMLEEEGD